MKKTVIILSSISLLVLLMIILFFKSFNGSCLEVYINEGVLLSKPTSVDIIYRYTYGEGEDFYIFNYDTEEDINKIIKKNNFKRITKNNLEEITKVLNIYRNDLCETELKKFDKTINILELTKTGNYFLYPEDMDMEDDNDYSIQIIFPEDKMVYHFAINH